jgi:hypothetical protein
VGAILPVDDELLLLGYFSSKKLERDARNMNEIGGGI